MALYRRHWVTVAQLIDDAVKELGLQTATISDPFAETSTHVIQLLALLKSLGQDLVAEYDWSQLVKEAHLQTDAEQENALPDDFHHFVDDTTQNRTTVLTPQVVTPQQWQQLQAWTAAGSVTISYRLRGLYMQIHPSANASEDLYYEYVSAYWVQTDPTTLEAPDADIPGEATHRVWFDRRLMVAGLKYRWLADRGLPSDAALRAYEAALELAKANSDTAKAIDLSEGNTRFRFRINLPETGWGA